MRPLNLCRVAWVDEAHGIAALLRGVKNVGWQPRHTFEQGLEATVRWFLENLDWCQAVQQGNG